MKTRIAMLALVAVIFFSFTGFTTAHAGKLSTGDEKKVAAKKPQAKKAPKMLEYAYQGESLKELSDILGVREALKLHKWNPAIKNGTIQKGDIIRYLKDEDPVAVARQEGKKTRSVFSGLSTTLSGIISGVKTQVDTTVSGIKTHVTDEEKKTRDAISDSATAVNGHTDTAKEEIVSAIWTVGKIIIAILLVIIAILTAFFFIGRHSKSSLKRRIDRHDERSRGRNNLACQTTKTAATQINSNLRKEGVETRTKIKNLEDKVEQQKELLLKANNSLEESAKSRKESEETLRRSKELLDQYASAPTQQP